MIIKRGDIVTVRKTWYANDRHLTGRRGVVIGLCKSDPIVHVGTRTVRALEVSK